jgi:hypothetical protein
MTTMEAIRKQATEEVLTKLVEGGHRLSAAERRTLDAHVAAAVVRHVEKHQEEARARPETLIEKIQRAQDYAAALEDAIVAYAKAHNCSRARAVDAVIFHPTTSEYHRLDKALAAAQREAIADREMSKAERKPKSDFPSMSPEQMRTSLNSGSPGDDNIVESADAVLQRLADVQQQKNPAMTWAQAVTVAANSREFGEAHRAEKVRKGL